MLDKRGPLSSCERLVVLGGGVTGQETASYLARQGMDVLLSDSASLEGGVKSELEGYGVEVEEGGHSGKVLEGDMIVLSPGVPPTIPRLKEARLAGIPVIGETELAYLVSGMDRIIAVTGTNGKTTTVRLIAEILKGRGTMARTCGNVGNPFISVVEDLGENEVPVLEVSSYQLETIDRFKPRVGILLNIAPDHLERHGGMEGYRKAKLRLFENQGPSDFSLVNPDLLSDIPDLNSEVVTFDPDEFTGYGLAPHNRVNLAAAVRGVECVLGEDLTGDWISGKMLERAIGAPHRLERVAERNGVVFIDDSKATNPHATVAALNSLARPVYLLLGGRAKQGGYDSLVDKVKDSSVKFIYFFGEATDELAELFSAGGYTNFSLFAEMEEALLRATDQAIPGSVILLSPACSSFDAYQNFEERGRKFTETVQKIQETRLGTD